MEWDKVSKSGKATQLYNNFRGRLKQCIAAGDNHNFRCWLDMETVIHVSRP